MTLTNLQKKKKPTIITRNSTLQTICGGKFVLHGGNDCTRDSTPSCGNTFRIVIIVQP